MWAHAAPFEPLPLRRLKRLDVGHQVHSCTRPQGFTVGDAHRRPRRAAATPTESGPPRGDRLPSLPTPPNLICSAGFRQPAPSVGLTSGPFQVLRAWLPSATRHRVLRLPADDHTRQPPRLQRSRLSSVPAVPATPVPAHTVQQSCTVPHHFSDVGAPTVRRPSPANVVRQRHQPDGDLHAGCPTTW